MSHIPIERAQALHTDFYTRDTYFERAKDEIFAKSWQYGIDANDIPNPQDIYPIFLQKNYLNEPILFTRDKEQKVHCVSNVCTHRGKIIVDDPNSVNMLSCGYHGRCFRLDGTFKSMPAFEKAENFPTNNDNLHKISFAEWANMIFVSLDPKHSFQEVFQPIMDRIGWMPLDTLEYQPADSKDYVVNGHWALYVENYLEGFHVPFVHERLGSSLSYDEYGYETFDFCNLQLGIAKDGETVFDIPEGAQDYGKKVYAYYFWVYPNLMLNFYPWGVSTNMIDPISKDLTLARFRTYTFAGTPHIWEDSHIHITELEDEEVVESVQQGIKSRFYNAGRYSPTMEKCVHHFHSLLRDAMDLV